VLASSVMAPDVELLERWRAGDEAAGRALVDRHFDGVCRFFRNKLDDDVDDLIQRTFLACLAHARDLRSETGFRAYLFAVARNELYAHLRRRHRDRERVPLEESAVADLGVVGSAVIAAHEEERLLLQALRQIPLEAQIVIELHYWEGLGVAELATVLGVPEGTAKSRLRRGRARLEDCMRRLAASPGVLDSTLARLDDWASGLRAQVGIATPDPGSGSPSERPRRG
jgi:RNA polymerase sigma factor (sigma-70 family)